MKQSKMTMASIRRDLDEIVSEEWRITMFIQVSAYKALEFAREGELKLANELIRALNKGNDFAGAMLLVDWFELHGKVKWNSKKGKLMNDVNGAWKLTKAKECPWCNSKLLSEKLATGDFDYDYTKLSNSFLISNKKEGKTLVESSIGQWGLPGDKNKRKVEYHDSTRRRRR